MIAIAHLRILAVKRSPGGINGNALFAFQFKIATPVFVFAAGNSKGRLKQAIVDVNS